MRRQTRSIADRRPADRKPVETSSTLNLAKHRGRRSTSEAWHSAACCPAILSPTGSACGSRNAKFAGNDARLRHHLAHPAAPAMHLGKTGEFIAPASNRHLHLRNVHFGAGFTSTPLHPRLICPAMWPTRLCAGLHSKHLDGLHQNALPALKPSLMLTG